MEAGERGRNETGEASEIKAEEGEDIDYKRRRMEEGGARRSSDLTVIQTFGSFVTQGLHTAAKRGPALRCVLVCTHTQIIRRRHGRLTENGLPIRIISRTAAFTEECQPSDWILCTIIYNNDI